MILLAGLSMRRPLLKSCAFTVIRFVSWFSFLLFACSNCFCWKFN